MYTLARVFQFLAERKPELDAGLYAYAKAGFGDYLGFLAVFGYWVGTCIGNVSYWVLIKATLGAFFPIFSDGNTLIAIAVASMGIWLFHALILRGTQQAAFINQVVTIAKVVPIITFIIISGTAFKFDLYRANFFGGAGYENVSMFDQVRATMLVTVFVFPRYRRCERLLALCAKARRYRHGDHHWIHCVTCPDGSCHALAVRPSGTRRDRRNAASRPWQRFSNPPWVRGVQSSSASACSCPSSGLPCVSLILRRSSLGRRAQQ